MSGDDSDVNGDDSDVSGDASVVSGDDSGDREGADDRSAKSRATPGAHGADTGQAKRPRSRRAQPKRAASPQRALSPDELLAAAVERGADVTLIEKLIGFHERAERTAARTAFEEAMAAVRADLPPIRKNRLAGRPGRGGGDGSRRGAYRHEDLGEIAKTVNPILARHGISYRFRTRSEPGRPVSVTCVLSHRAGHTEENTLEAARDDSGEKNSIQAVGSTITYLQRYTLKAALGLAAAHDDDAASAAAATGGERDCGHEGELEGGDEPITDDQLAQLTALLDDAGADARRFCAYLGIETLATLPQSRLGEAAAAAEARRRARASLGGAS